MRLGALYEAAGGAGDAVRQYRRALAARPDQEDVRRRLAAASGEAPPTPVATPEAGPALDAIHEEAAPAGGNGSDTPDDEAVARPAATILVADDSELALDMVSETLEAAGYRVLKAADGKQALELARQQRPDLMILDGLMPGKNGFDVCKEIKEQLYPDDPPRVLIWSAIYTKQRQRTEARELYRADDLLPKATDDDHLLSTIRHHLGRA